MNFGTDHHSQADSGQGAWIFLSHSNKDFEKVREIRNELEKRGHKPIMFYLKCLENDNAMLPDLLRREIAAREWFILCDSPNAQASRHVRDEVELIKSMEGKAFEVVDLSKGLQTELHKLIRVTKRATVFISYASADRETADRIRRGLLLHEFSVRTQEDIGASSQTIQSIITLRIDEAIEHGFALLLLSEASLKSQYCGQEALYALDKAAASRRSNVVPVVIANFQAIKESLPPSLMLALGGIQSLDLSTGPLDDRIADTHQKPKNPRNGMII